MLAAEVFTDRDELHLLGLLALAFGAFPAAATPYDNLIVGDPVEDELRILDMYPAQALQNRIRLPHLDSRPLQLIEMQGVGPAPEHPDRVLAISLARIERAFGRDRSPLFAPHYRYESTPRLFESSSEKTRFEVSTGVEGVGTKADGHSAFASGSGFQGRIALGLDRLVAYSHYVVGHYENAQRFADPVATHNSDLIVHTEENFISYTEEQGAWGILFGRSRWHWGPGQEGSLLLSRTSPQLTGIAFRAHHQALRADGVALNATLAQAAGEQLAAHRIEWQLTDGLRAGVSEAARYKSATWQPLYLVGFIPYVLVQRLEVQSEPDSSAALRNNVLMSCDVTWRVAEGTRIYGELLLDDVHVSSPNNPNKIGYQVGWEGAGTVADQRVTWGGEWTRINRYVYTSYYGRSYVEQNQPLGFPTGPDSRRIRLRGTWDPSPDWTVFGFATNSDKGENNLDEPYIPGSGHVRPSRFLGIVETTREIEMGARYWPASGVYVSVSGGYRWTSNAGHVFGADRGDPIATVELRLDR